MMEIASLAPLIGLFMLVGCTEVSELEHTKKLANDGDAFSLSSDPAN